MLSYSHHGAGQEVVAALLGTTILPARVVDN
jgi:hypothetical protein